MRPVIVVGAGLAGVSTAYHLPNRNVILIERENEFGGTARSFNVNGFTFDITGHLLHLHHSYTRKLISKLLKNNVFHCVRRAAIHLCDVTTPYPFQANTKGLPESVIDQCVVGYAHALANRDKLKVPFSDMDFEQWCHAVFGQGIASHFMIPYNQKLYQTQASSMNVEWCGRFIPTPTLDEVIKGALIGHTKEFGYNTTFLYPKKGGIQVLASSMGTGLSDVRFNTQLERVDWQNKRAYFSDGVAESYSHLVSSLPLPEFLKRIESAPGRVTLAAQRLKFAGVLCVNLGVDRPKISDKSWIYFPEKKYPFYRVGFPMNFTPHVVPAGHSSMYVEVPISYVGHKSKEILLKEIKQGLVDAGILFPSDKFVVTQFIPIKYAYVIYDQSRSAALDTIFTFLKENQIFSIGRYGGWKYSFMEEAILDGKNTATEILSESH